MNRSQYLAAIKATGPGITARFVEGEFRVSIDPAAIRAAFPMISYAESIERNESLAIYETDGDSALESAKALRESWLKGVVIDNPDTDYARAAKAELAPAPVVETIDMTPTWAAVASIFIACLEDGTEAGRVSARAELRRMAGLADERNKFAERLASMQAMQTAFESDMKELACTKGRASLEGIDRVNVFNAAIKAALAGESN